MRQEDKRDTVVRDSLASTKACPCLNSMSPSKYELRTEETTDVQLIVWHVATNRDYDDDHNDDDY